ncbi:MAG: FIST N-terminal domain-containing protein [Desulfobaccales bacterium]|jgi:hypothetical protein
MFKAATVTLKNRFSRDMGRRLGKALVEKLGDFPQACWLFCSPQTGQRELLKGIVSAVRTHTLVGCTTDGEISSEGFSTGSAVLGGIASDQIDFQVACATNLGQDSEKAGQELARAFSPGTSYLQLFSDGLTGNGCALLRGMAGVLGRQTPIAGGTAGDGGEFVRTRQYIGDQVLTDAAVAIGLSGNFQVGTGVRSGWSPLGIAKRVTRASGNVLYELGGQPALEVYERFLGKHAERLPAVGVEYPMGLVDDSGYCGGGEYHLLRATMSVNREDGSISFAGEIPEGAMVRMTCGDTDAILEATGRAVELAQEDLGGRSPVMAFFYSCMARRIVLGRRTKEEIEHIRQKVGREIPILGFYTYGEYCRVSPGGPSFLHNETATVSLIGI